MRYIARAGYVTGWERFWLFERDRGQKLEGYDCRINLTCRKDLEEIKKFLRCRKRQYEEDTRRVQYAVFRPSGTERAVWKAQARVVRESFKKYA